MSFGLTPQGFIPMQQQDVINDLEAALKGEFGNNVNLGANAVFGQLVGILSERFALLWQLGEAIYDSQYPTGAEGTSVDNILALNNLQRLAASATVTNPTPVKPDPAVVLNGLVLCGVAGTLIPSGSLIQNTASPPIQFSTVNPVTLGAPANAVQSVFYSSQPTQGAFKLNLTEGPVLAGNAFGATLGNVLTTGAIEWNAVSTSASIAFSATPTGGTFAITLTQAGIALVTGAISHTANAAAIQTAIRALGTPYASVSVSGSFGAGFVITYGAISHPICTVTSNSLTNGGSVTATPLDSIQALINNLLDSTETYYPYTDVTVTGFTVGLVVTFGGLTSAVGANPQSRNQPQPLMTVSNNTLETGSTVVNLNVVNSTQGNGIGDATTGVTPAAGIATVTGPNFIAAGTITSIASPISGWTRVYNQLDCITGTNVENDTQALVRRSNLLAAQANGPLQAIVEKVQKVIGVTAAIGFQNLNNAAQQALSFASVPSSGAFTLTVGAQTTSSIPYTAASTDIQTAIRNLTGYSTALVTGTMAFGFVIDFNGSNGGQGVPLFTVTNNTTGVVATLAFGRPPHSFEIVVLGGADADIAQAIYGSQPGGIGSYGLTTVQIFDSFNNPVNISFSRPTEIPIFVTIALTTDTYNTPGSSGSGANPNAKFNPQSVGDIQSDIITIGGEVGIGGLVIGFGSSGLIGAFNGVPGIVSYTISFGIGSNPSTNTNVQMQAEQVPLFESFNVIVSYS